MTIRKATFADVPAIETLIALSSRTLGRAEYSSKQIEAALLGTFGVDRSLISDGTSFLVQNHDGTLLACGAWSRRATLFGGDAAEVRDERFLDPATEPARIRAFFVHPDHARRGIGRLLLARCEQEASLAGFREATLVATLPGVPFYLAAGYWAGEPLVHRFPDGSAIEFLVMGRRLGPTQEPSIS